MGKTDMVEAIQAYIARIDQEKSQGRSVLRQEDFEAIAVELGFDEAARQELEARANEHMLKGQGYRGQGLYDEAIEAYGVALELEPWCLEPVKAMAETHTHAWEASGQPHHQSRGQELCQQWIERVPADTEPYALIKRLQTQPTHNSGSGRRLAWGVAVLAVLVGTIALNVDDSRSSPGGIAETVSTEVERAPEPIPSSSMSPLNGGVDTPPEPEIEVALAIPEDKPKLAGLDIDLDRVNPYRLSYQPDEINISVKGHIVNGTSSKIESIKVEFQVLGEQEELLWKERKDYILDSNIEYRPGDLIPLSVFLKHSIPEDVVPARIMMEPYSVSLTSAAQHYAPSPVVEHTWLNPPGSHLNVQIRERQYSVSNSMEKGSYFHQAVYEVENTGQEDLELLKLEFEWDQVGQEPLSEGKLVVWSTEPRLRVGDTRLIFVMDQVASKNVRPTVKVVEIE